MAVLSAQNLTLLFGDKTVFQNVSFDLNEKDKVGFIGLNGAGKTSLFKVITGEYTPDSGGCFLGKNVKVGYMEQHTCSENRTVYDELISVFDYLIETENELKEITAKLLKNPSNELIERQDELTNYFQQNNGLTYKSLTRSSLLGLGFSENEFNMPTAKLSGGQKSKLILAKLLLSKADLLLLDEPTNHLDMSAIEWLEDYLINFKGSFIVISHDRYFLDKITNRTIEIDNKKFYSYKGNYSEFVAKKQVEQKAIEEKYENDLKEIERIEGIIEQQRRWNREKNIKTAESKEKMIERIKAQMIVPDSKAKKIRFDFSCKFQSGEDVLDVKELSKSFGNKKVFSGVSFEVKRGERLFLIGNNGCGKTTLLKILMKDYVADDGSFKFGTNVFTGYFDQVQAKLNLEKTVLDEVWSSFPALTETTVRNALAAFLFKGDEVYKVLNTCSGGERARVALLKLMLGKYNFLLLDEPTNHLDVSSREELEKTLLNYDGTMLVVSHDRYFINKIATSILEMDSNGVKRYNGNYDYYLEKRIVRAESRKQDIKPKKSSNDYKERKEKTSNIKKLKTQISKLEIKIDNIEEEIVAVEQEIQTNPNYEELLELTNKLDELNNEKDNLYDEWDNLSLKLTNLEA